MSNSNLDLTRAFLRSFETRDGSTFAYYAADVVYRALPNRLLPSGATRDLAMMALAAERGKESVTEERYEVLNLVGAGDEVAAEVLWSARLLVPLGSLPAGTVMRAHLGMFLTWRDGKIVSQRNYDCFEPF
jgi:ketosteroid isomerase-like protein